MLAPMVEIFCEIDDFCKEWLVEMERKVLPKPNRKRRRCCQMSLSELMTIMILFQLSHFRTFKDFYHESLSTYLKDYFPTLLCYTRLIELQPSVISALTVYLLTKSGEKTGYYFIDSSPSSL